MKFLTCFLVCVSAFAQRQGPPPKPAAPKIDKAKLETYLRHVELWVPDVNVKIDDPKPVDGMPGFNQLTVHLSYKQASLDQNNYVSSDGQKVFKGEVWDLNKSPFQDALDKLNITGQPSYGGDEKTAVNLGLRRFPVPVLQSRGHHAPPADSRDLPRQGSCGLHGFPTGSDSPLGQARIHRRPVYRASERRRVLEISRLDLRDSI